MSSSYNATQGNTHGTCSADDATIFTYLVIPVVILYQFFMQSPATQQTKFDYVFSGLSLNYNDY
jgi:hypothetical protein